MESVPQSEPFEWRGTAFMMGRSYGTNGTWPFGWFRLHADGRIEIQSLFTRLLFTPEEVVEAHFYRWPFPTFTAVVRNSKGFHKVGFSAFRGSLLLKRLADCRITLTQSHTWYVTGMTRAEMKKYGFSDFGEF
ncbi:MAG: hypothetical protein HS117_03075 [Verrucomicrobiaceae bacterium]|jgi:hypothetical protein|nr:hypothetical protein [Verrucomicrobiaceae bacterium]